MRTLLWVLLLAGPGNALAQTIPVELMAAPNLYRWQHFFSKPLHEGSRWGYFHTSSLLVYADKSRSDELMSQAYATYQLGRKWKLAAGTWFVNGPGLRPALALHFVHRTESLTLSLVPRVDLYRNAAMELFGVVEYRPQLSARLRLYTRVQSLNSYGPWGHQRSYQNYRLGLMTGNTQMGVAYNLEFYGRSRDRADFVGLFVQQLLK